MAGKRASGSIRPIPTVEQLDLFIPPANVPKVIRESLDALRAHPTTDSQKFTVQQRRVYWYALAQLSSLQTTEKGEFLPPTKAVTIKIPVRDIAPQLGAINKSSTLVYEELIRDIVQNSMVTFRNPSERTIQLLGREKGTKGVAGAIFINAAYRNGFIDVDINPKMVPILCALSVGYVAYDRLEAFSLSSTYSQLLFTLLSSFLDLGRLQLNLDDLKLRLRAGAYDEYKDFKRRVLTAAVDEIGKKTLLQVTYKEVRVARKVESIVFEISTKDAAYRKVLLEETNATLETIMALPEEIRQHRTRAILLEEFTFTAKQVDEIVNSLLKTEEFARLYTKLKNGLIDVKTDPTRYFASILFPRVTKQ